MLMKNMLTIEDYSDNRASSASSALIKSCIYLFIYFFYLSNYLVVYLFINQPADSCTYCPEETNRTEISDKIDLSENGKKKINK